MKELAEIDQIIDKLEARRVDIVNMLDVLRELATLGPFETPPSDNDLTRETVVPISIKSDSDNQR